MSDDTITSPERYAADLAEATDIVADTLAELDPDPEQIAKSINDALNDTWTEGVTVDEWADLAIERLEDTAKGDPMSDHAPLPTATSYPRRIVQIATCNTGSGEFSLLALADDGSLWAKYSPHPGYPWNRVIDLPAIEDEPTPPTTTKATL